jgi:hypothetical protein
MVTKKKSTGEKEAKRRKVTVRKLNLNKETVMDLSLAERKRIKGGREYPRLPELFARRDFASL